MSDAVAVSRLTVRLGSYEPVNDVSFTLPQGAFTVVAGPNGAGKSVLLKTILGLYAKASGTITLWDKPHGEHDPMAIGYVPQIKTLQAGFPALGLDLVVSGMRGSWPGRITAPEREAAQAALARVGADRLADKVLGHLSGGELQRVYLARSLARHPRLFILDEPATGIDTVGEADLYHILEQERARGATIIMVSHDLHAAMHHASHVLVLNRTVVAFGAPPETLGDSVLKRAFGHQRHAHGMGIGHD